MLQEFIECRNSSLALNKSFNTKCIPQSNTCLVLLVLLNGNDNRLNDDQSMDNDISTYTIQRYLNVYVCTFMDSQN